MGLPIMTQVMPLHLSRTSSLLSIGLVVLIELSILCGSVAGSSRPASWDYAELQAVLTYVDSEGMVNYRELKRNRDHLDRFSTSLAELQPATYASWERCEKIAFWINAYNGLTLKAIVDHYPIQASFPRSIMYPKNSIRQISGIWDDLKFTVLGDEITLDYIEHSILRKEFREPRIHMALVCAAKGCPPLRQEPYVGTRLDEQLDAQTRAFLSDSIKFRIERSERIIYLSKIFDWFSEDFIDRHGTGEAFQSRKPALKAVLNFVCSYLPEPDCSYLRNTKFRIKYLEYDWSLNEQGR